MLTLTSNDILVTELSKSINSLFTEFTAYKAAMVKPKDPTPTDVVEWIKANDPKAYAAYAKVVAKAELALKPEPGDITVLTAQREGYNATRKSLIATLEALKGHMLRTDSTGVDQVSAMLSTIQSPTVNKTNGEVSVIRDWADKNGFKVAAKGRISAEIMTAYEKSKANQ